MIEFLVTNFYPISGAILLACFAGYINWRNGRKNRFAAAATKFRNAFNPELTILESKTTESINVRKLLLGTFTKHSEAVTEFCHHINSFNRAGFDKAWQQYQCNPDFDSKKWGLHGEDSILLQYISVNDEEMLKAKKHAIKNIHCLLEYAE